MAQASAAAHHVRAMTTRARSAIPAFALAALSILMAVFTGVAWLGQPLRMVQLLTLVGVSMTAGVSLTQAIWRVRNGARERAGDPPGS
jgi:hypothetical protein